MTKWKKLTTEEPNGFITCGINMGLHRWQIRAMYCYAAPSVYCPWFHYTSQRQFPIYPTVVPHGMQKKNIAAPGKAGYQLCIKLRTLVEHAKIFLASSHTLHRQLHLENSIAGTKNHTQLFQCLHTKKSSLLWASDCRCWWCGKELLLGIFGYQRSICTEDEDAL